MKTVDEIARYLATAIEEVSLGEHSSGVVSPDDTLLGTLGLDSLDYATVVLMCEKWLGVKIEEDGVHWADLQSVRDLAEFFSERQDGARRGEPE